MLALLPGWPSSNQFNFAWNKDRDDLSLIYHKSKRMKLQYEKLGDSEKDNESSS
jgi:hypothetical protein